VVQVEYAPIILTGAGALNKVLGRQVYQSNLQLGGTRIMHTNGVSHLVAENDLTGVYEIINWLSYVPETNKSSLPVINSLDPVDRVIDVEITKSAYDPRVLLQGRMENDEWKSGFFDKGSFTETLQGWAKGVIVGRARLGGIPIGCISVETRATETVVFADPAVESSQEEQIKEAGQVWYPNSAHKTAQAIKDFNNGEQLPMIIFANWRGFSGGQSDMSKEVLKFGAQIVDSLREFKQPIFIYVIGELRGGAWVVVDPSINPEMMEMYCSENARGGVLEPQGIVEIKYRTPRVISCMQRLDPTYQGLRSKLASATSQERVDIEDKIQKFEDNLIPIFEQAAVELADLHDRPERMLQKNVIKKVIDWRTSRQYFYTRLLRRIKEDSLISKIETITSKDFKESKELVQLWFRGEYPFIPFDNDKVFVDWVLMKQQDIQKNLDSLMEESVVKEVLDLGKRDLQLFAKGLKAIIDGLSREEKEALALVFK
jgi:acetyl-CoA carboxylase/biotin carboxylase 1